MTWSPDGILEQEEGLRGKWGPQEAVPELCYSVSLLTKVLRSGERLTLESGLCSETLY